MSLFKTVIKKNKVYLVFVTEELCSAYWDVMYGPDAEPLDARVVCFSGIMNAIEIDAINLTHSGRYYLDHSNDNVKATENVK